MFQCAKCGEPVKSVLHVCGKHDKTGGTVIPG